MAKIKHIAIATQDPDETARFYKEVFDLTEVGRVAGENAEGYYLSDGNVNLAILRFKNPVVAGELGADYSGIHHIGFQVDDAEAADSRLRAAGSLPDERRAASWTLRATARTSSRSTTGRRDGGRPAGWAPRRQPASNVGLSGVVDSTTCEVSHSVPKCPIPIWAVRHFSEKWDRQCPTFRIWHSRNKMGQGCSIGIVGVGGGYHADRIARYGYQRSQPGRSRRLWGIDPTR